MSKHIELRYETYEETIKVVIYSHRGTFIVFQRKDFKNLNISMDSQLLFITKLTSKEAVVGLNSEKRKFLLNFSTWQVMSSSWVMFPQFAKKSFLDHKNIS